jgi:hypothetical protein
MSFPLSLLYHNWIENGSLCVQVVVDHETHLTGTAASQMIS